MKSAKAVFNVMTIIFLALLVFWFTELNYDNLGFEENRNVYLGIFSVCLMIYALQMIKRSIGKKK